MTETITDLFSILTIVAQVAIVVLIIAFIASKTTKKQNVITEFIQDNAIVLSFSVALAATLGSLFYSEIAGYDPCKLCWYQRILMYPQALILGLAIWKKEAVLDLLAIIMSALGAVIAFYHYLGQIAVVSDLPCSTIGYSASCSQRFFMEYGYITIPMMALTGFAVILVALLVKKFSK